MKERIPALSTGRVLTEVCEDGIAKGSSYSVELAMCVNTWLMNYHFFF